MVKRGLTAFFICLLAFAPASVFGYSVDLSIEPTPSVIAPNTNATFQLWMRNIRLDVGDPAAFIGAVDIELNALPAGFSFQPATGGDGFDENTPPIGAGSELDLTLDGSLLDGDLDLSYAAFLTPGIPITGTNRMLGTFVVQATTPGIYTLSINPAGSPGGTFIQTTGFVFLNITSFTGANVTVTPEPATCLLGLGSLVMMLASRRKFRKKVDA